MDRGERRAAIVGARTVPDADGRLHGLTLRE